MKIFICLLTIIQSFLHAQINLVDAGESSFFFGGEAAYSSQAFSLGGGLGMVFNGRVSGTVLFSKSTFIDNADITANAKGFQAELAILKQNDNDKGGTISIGYGYSKTSLAGLVGSDNETNANILMVRLSSKSKSTSTDMVLVPNLVFSHILPQKQDPINAIQFSLGLLFTPEPKFRIALSPYVGYADQLTNFGVNLTLLIIY